MTYYRELHIIINLSTKSEKTHTHTTKIYEQYSIHITPTANNIYYYTITRNCA